jgi:anti-sigma factor RsiW
MSVTPMLNDAELVAYVDGRLSPERMGLITVAAKTDAAMAARIGELAAGSPDLSALWGDMLGSVPAGLMPEPLVASLAQTNRRALLSGLGGTAFGLVLGLGGWKLLVGAGDAGVDWETAVADYHALYGASTVRGLNPSAAAREIEVAAVEAESGLVVPSLDLPGLTYRRAQMLDLRGRPIVHVVMTTADVVPIAFCLTADGGPVRQPRYRPAGDMGLVTWADGVAAYCLVARLPEDALLALAEKLSA